jgi:hypothetical protein
MCNSMAAGRSVLTSRCLTSPANFRRRGGLLTSRQSSGPQPRPTTQTIPTPSISAVGITPQTIATQATTPTTTHTTTQTSLHITCPAQSRQAWQARRPGQPPTWVQLRASHRSSCSCTRATPWPCTARLYKVLQACRRRCGAGCCRAGSRNRRCMMQRGMGACLLLPQGAAATARAQVVSWCSLQPRRGSWSSHCITGLLHCHELTCIRVGLWAGGASGWLETSGWKHPEVSGCKLVAVESGLLFQTGQH